jgi:hypothetical protein
MAILEIPHYGRTGTRRATRLMLRDPDHTDDPPFYWMNPDFDGPFRMDRYLQFPRNWYPMVIDK